MAVSGYNVYKAKRHQSDGGKPLQLSRGNQN